jgi:hypothetical protein
MEVRLTRAPRQTTTRLFPRNQNVARKTVVVSVAVPMPTTDTSKLAVDGWRMPSYLMRVALAHAALRFPNPIPDTAAPMKSITNRTQSVPGRIGGFLSPPVSTVPSPHSPQTTNRKRTFQSRNVQQCTRALPMATRYSLHVVWQ